MAHQQQPHAPQHNPLASAGHFFGMTTLGATDPFTDNSAGSLRYPFHELPLDAFMAAFDRHRLGPDSEVARTLQVDGGETIFRGKLGAMLNDVLGRQAAKAELQAWFTFCDYDRGCMMTRAEHVQAVQLLREFSANPQRARQYSSFDRWRADHRQHRRVEWSPQSSQQEPLTATQQIGWHAAKPHAKPPADEQFPLAHTDVTLREGRNAATYYGYMTLL